MDKRFQNSIKTMDSLSERTEKLHEHITDQFDQVKKDQKTIDGLLNELDKKIDKSLNDFDNDSKKKIDDINSFIEKIKSDSLNASENISSSIKDIKEDYSDRVANLIKDIDAKSKEILSIYDELDKIKKIQKDGEKLLESMAEKQEHLFSDLKNESSKLIKDLDVSVMTKTIESLSAKIKKLEKHAHTHTFGGTKI